MVDINIAKRIMEDPNLIVVPTLDYLYNVVYPKPDALYAVRNRYINAYVIYQYTDDKWTRVTEVFDNLDTTFN